MSKLRLLAAAALLAASGSSFATLTMYRTSLVPEAVGATGSGEAIFIYDSAVNDLRITFHFEGLSGNSTVAHIHCCTAAAFGGTVGVAVTPNTLPGFPTGVKSGSYDQVIDLDVQTNFTPAFFNASGGTLAGARDRLLNGMHDGFAYLNVHSSAFPTGEIRGFITIPEPTSFALAGLALAGIGLSRRARRG